MTATQIRPAGATATPSAAVPWRALPVVLLAQFLAVIDFFIVNVALPSIGTELRADPSTLQFVVAGYGVTYACCLVAGGRLGDAYGRRRLLVLGMAGFTLASLACGFAPSAVLLVAARVVQGAAAGAMAPQVLATIQAAFPGAARVRALGLFGATIGLGTVAGQVIGGALVQADVAGLGWRPIFLVNVPLGIVGLIAARLVPQTRAARPVPVDRRGATLLAATLALLLVPISVGRELQWPWWCGTALAIAPVAGLLFVADQRRAERQPGRAPLLPPSLLREPGMRRGLTAVALFFPAVGGFMFVVAVTLQYGLRWSALSAGFALTPMALGFLVMSIYGQRIVARYGVGAIVAGAIACAAGFAALGLQVSLGYERLSLATLAPAMAVAGLGGGLVMVPLFGIVLAAVPAPVAGAASGVLTTTQQAGLAVGVAAIGSLFLTVSSGGSGWAAGTTVGLLVSAGFMAGTAAALTRLARPIR